MTSIAQRITIRIPLLKKIQPQEMRPLGIAQQENKPETIMKKGLMIIASFFLLQACSNNGGESGVVNDGIKAVDSNGALDDSRRQPRDSSVDSSIGDDRVDTEKRDSSKVKKDSKH